MADPQRRRIVAIDVVRGLAIVGMLLVNNAGIPTAMPSQLRHAPWQGLTFADLVFPLFLFTVGASMPFSERAQRPPAVLRRVGALVVLGSLLVSAKQLRLAPSTGVLQQIAGAYLLAWVALKLPRRTQFPAGVAVLAGCGPPTRSSRATGSGAAHGRQAPTWPISSTATCSASSLSMVCWSWWPAV